jgi:hypothetical protein
MAKPWRALEQPQNLDERVYGLQPGVMIRSQIDQRPAPCRHSAGLKASRMASRAARIISEIRSAWIAGSRPIMLCVSGAHASRLAHFPANAPAAIAARLP